MATSTIKYDTYYENVEHIANGLFGAQGHSTLEILDNIDLDTCHTPGDYMITNATNYPNDGANSGKLFVIQTKKDDFNNVFQVYFPNYGNIFGRRQSWNSSQSAFVWGSWRSLW